MSITESWLRSAMNPPKYLLATLVASIGGLLNGIDTGTIGPVTQMPFFTEQFGTISPTTQGLIVSSLMLTAAFTSFFAGDVSDSFGRPRSIAVGALLYALGAALETGAVNLGMLIGGRLLVGTGEGLFLGPVIVYVTEISPPRWRGALCTLFQLFTTLGLVVGFFVAYGTVNLDSTLSWRLPFAIHASFAVLLVLGACFYLPQSPRWLSHHGRREEAAKVWDDLGVASAEREKDVLENPNLSLREVLAEGPPEASSPSATPRTTITHDHEAAPSPHPRTLRGKLIAFTSIFSPMNRKATLIGMFMVAMQQLSGIDGIIYYAPQLFKEAGLASSQANFLASGVSAICLFTFTIPAVLLADRIGRRPSTVYGGLILLACMSTMALLYATGSVHGDTGVARWIVIAMIYVFSIVYSMTWAIGLRIFASEIQPMRTRATAASAAQALNCLANFFVAFVTPILLAKASYAIYVLFSGCLALTVGVSLIYMPETKGQDLETVQKNFAQHKATTVPWKRVWKETKRVATEAGRFLARSRMTGLRWQRHP